MNTQVGILGKFMGDPGYTPRYYSARKLLRRGLCPEEANLEHIYEQGWEFHLNKSERDVAEDCLRQYGLEDKWL